MALVSVVVVPVALSVPSVGDSVVLSVVLVEGSLLLGQALREKHTLVVSIFVQTKNTVLLSNQK